MHRRDFLKTAAQVSAARAACSALAGPAPAATSDAHARPASPILTSYTAGDHRRRLENIGLCERSIRTCMRTHLIASYLPAQCCYNLGEYPCRKPWDPDQWDEQELDRLREHGIQLIQVHEEWNDSQRLFGGHKLAPLNPAGFRRFVEMVHRRGGIVKVHRGGATRPQTDLKVYDYLWVGEGGRSGDRLREAVKDHPPYVVPCLDMSRATVENEEELYLHSIPYLQFPLLLAGRPFTGERAAVPGIKYPPEEQCFWTRHCRAIWKHYQANPDGPHSYGWWDSVPGRPAARPTHARWLKRYLPLVEEGTWAWLEIGQSSLFAASLPKEVVASAYANRELYLVLANYGRSAAEVGTSDAYVPADSPSASPTKLWRIPARSLVILRRST